MTESQFKQFSEDLRSKIGLDLHSDSPFKSVFLTTEEERDKLDLMTLVRNNEIDLFCCSPESLMTTSKDIMWLEVLCSMANKVSTIIIDEAHVIGDWEGSFRPTFKCSRGENAAKNGQPVSKDCSDVCHYIQ